MDFAENYICGFAEEIQSAYFDKNAVTLHPVVIYTKDKEDEVKVKHKLLVVVSDELSHTSSTVFAIMKHVVKKVKAVLQNVEMAHYMTDSPMSQYRNKQIFYIVAHHDSIFPGIKAFWLYFEAGHGKGPRDGVGGTAKRLADMAVKRHSAIIHALKYILVPKSQCTEANEELSNLVGKQVKGTIQVHAVIPLGEGSIAVRNTSCFCDKCFVDGQPRNQLVQNSEAEQTTGHDENEFYQVYTYVAVIYESRWYVGEVLEYDKDDQEYNINFMVAGKNSFKWPVKPDQIWIPSSDVLCSLDEPIKQVKTRNMFKFSG
ncbi:hypothetical protein ACJMK2_033589 [Sinanodonta woodiana]|uniref:Uncharacterized protein n=1 Tax=Sinanodonta woodiana TaxID=1069815 RepID=A0ABD3WNW4_SINWO